MGEYWEFPLAAWPVFQRTLVNTLGSGIGVASAPAPAGRLLPVVVHGDLRRTIVLADAMGSSIAVGRSGLLRLSLGGYPVVLALALAATALATSQLTAARSEANSGKHRINPHEACSCVHQTA